MLFAVAATCVADETNLARNPGFEDCGDTSWNLGQHMLIEKGVGRNGSRGVRICNPDPTCRDVRLWQQGMPAESGRIYSYEAWIRLGGGLTNGPVYFNMTCYGRDGRSLCTVEGRPLIRQPQLKGKGWVKVSGATARTPAGTASVGIGCIFPFNSTGEVFVDDFKVTASEKRYMEYVYTSAYRDLAVDGQVTFAAPYICDPEECPVDDLAPEFSFVGMDGKECRMPADRVGKDVSKDTSFEVKIDVSRLAFGTQKVKAILRTKGGKTLDEAEVSFTRADKLPPRKVWFDSRNRLVVEGKPFFPLGMYFGKNTKEEFEVYRQAAFNTVFCGSSIPSLDLVHSQGLKAIVNTASFVEPEKLERVLHELKDHPAVLAWYTNDEMPPGLAPRQAMLQKVYRRVDPDHPTYSVLDKPWQVRLFMPTFDVIGMDPYPIGNHRGGIDIAYGWAASCVRQSFGLRPMWQVPQAFDWRWYRDGLDEPEFRFPTPDEFRSMTWQAIAAGANGLLYFSFGSMRARMKKPGEFERHWSYVKDTVAEVAKYVPVILSDGEPPHVDGATQAVPVRAWRSGNDVWLLVVNTLRHAQKATLRVDGAPAKAQKAHVAFGPAPEILSDGRLSFSFGPLEQTLLRLLPGAADGMAIRVPDGAKPATVRAARELRHYIREATGRTLPITNEISGCGLAYLGCDRDLGPDGYRLVSDGKRLEIRSSGRHGHLFGTYGFLKRFVGVEWYLSSFTNIPKGVELKLPSGYDRTEVPAFELRDLCELSTTKDIDFALHLRLHGRHFQTPYPESVGGDSFRMDKVLQNSHTFERILPASRHFKDHPEWFAERDGKRREVATQLCLTNPEVLARTIAFVLDRVRKNPDIKFFGVSQNDVQTYCTCSRCAAVDEEEGSHSGTVIRFVNAVAEAVEKVDPEVTITTLAYQYSVAPPKFAKPRRNVMIVLCDIGCDFSKPFGVSRAASNEKFARIVEGWKAAGARIYIWDYTTNYPYYQAPFHNEDVIAPNLRFFRDNSVTQVYEEGPSFAPHADSSELKTWMLSELMWDPDLDAEALKRKFISAVYGAGAPYVLRYYELRREMAKGRDERVNPMTCFEDISGYPVDFRFFARATDLWLVAAKAARGNAVAERQCRLGLFSTDAAHAIYATRQPAASNFVIARDRRAIGGPDAIRAQAAARRVVAFLKAEPSQRLAHGTTGKEDRMLKHQVKLFAEKDFATASTARFEAGPRSMKIDDVREYYRHVLDSGALEGEIVEMNPEFRMQGAKFFFRQAYVEPGCAVRCRLRMKIRTVPGGDPERLIVDGAIDAPKAKDGRRGRSIAIRAKDVKNGEWAWYDVGTVPKVDGLSRVWLGVNGIRESPCAEYIAFDRIEISLAEAAEN